MRETDTTDCIRFTADYIVKEWKILQSILIVINEVDPIRVRCLVEPHNHHIARTEVHADAYRQVYNKWDSATDSFLLFCGGIEIAVNGTMTITTSIAIILTLDFFFTSTWLFTDLVQFFLSYNRCSILALCIPLGVFHSETLVKPSRSIVNKQTLCHLDLCEVAQLIKIIILHFWRADESDPSVILQQNRLKNFPHLRVHESILGKNDTDSVETARAFDCRLIICTHDLPGAPIDEFNLHLSFVLPARSDELWWEHI